MTTATTATEEEPKQLTAEQVRQEMAAYKSPWADGIDPFDSVGGNGLYRWNITGQLIIDEDGRVRVPSGGLAVQAPESWQEVCEIMLPHLVFSASSSRWRGKGAVAGVAHQLAEKVADHLRLWSLHFNATISIPEPMTMDAVVQLIRELQESDGSDSEKRKPGRAKKPTGLTFRQERQIVTAWRAGRWKTYAGLATEKGTTGKDVKRIVGRDNRAKLRAKQAADK